MTKEITKGLISVEIPVGATMIESNGDELTMLISIKGRTFEHNIALPTGNWELIGEKGVLSMSDIRYITGVEKPKIGTGIKIMSEALNKLNALNRTHSIPQNSVFLKKVPKEERLQEFKIDDKHFIAVPIPKGGDDWHYSWSNNSIVFSNSENTEKTIKEVLLPKGSYKTVLINNNIDVNIVKQMLEYPKETTMEISGALTEKGMNCFNTIEWLNGHRELQRSYSPPITIVSVEIKPIPDGQKVKIDEQVRVLIEEF